jgi:16S rRNA (guanine527-N7)-methyltransferase
MNPERIAELLAPFLAHGPEISAPTSVRQHHSNANTAIEESAALSPAQAGSISTYIDLLLRWNSRINLTSVRQPEEIVTRHFGESLFTARHLQPGGDARRVGTETARPAESGPVKKLGSEVRVIDVGSGAGFPGLPIKIWAPQVHLTLIESNQKKSTFLREVVRSLALSNVEVFTGRAESFAGVNGDIVTLRAVERFDAILTVAARLVAPSGRLAVLVGEAQLSRVHELAPGLQWDNPTSLPLSTSRVLIIGRNESR